MKPDKLEVFVARFNPLRWQKPDKHFCEFVEHMLDSGVQLTVVEVGYGERDYVCNISPHLHHIGVRAESWAWSKENAIMLGIQRRPDAKYICWSDSDVFHRRNGWAVETVEALQHYHWMQPWSQCYDLGPNDEHLNLHHSFCSLYAQGKPVVPETKPMWKHDGGAYEYAHSGFCWATKRDILNRVGGLFDLGGMGSGDYHMALGAIGKIDWSVPVQPDPSYLAHLKAWEGRAVRAINGRIGFIHGTIEHRFHGKKLNRGYINRWDMFVKHGFNPNTDLKRNCSGVIEWAGNKPELERDWDNYLRSRREDDNASE
jgi:hypothetical protein